MAMSNGRMLYATEQELCIIFIIIFYEERKWLYNCVKLGNIRTTIYKCPVCMEDMNNTDSFQRKCQSYVRFHLFCVVLYNF